MGYASINWNLDSEDFRLAATPDQFMALLTSQLNTLGSGSIVHLQVGYGILGCAGQHKRGLTGFPTPPRPVARSTISSSKAST